MRCVSKGWIEVDSDVFNSGMDGRRQVVDNRMVRGREDEMKRKRGGKELRGSDDAVDATLSMDLFH